MSQVVSTNRAGALLSRDMAPVVVRRLVERRRDGGLTVGDVEFAAKALGCGVSTVYRWLASDRVPEGPPRGYRASREDIQAFFDRDGSYRAAFRQRASAEQHDPLDVSYDTYRRAVHRATSDSMRAYAKHGRRGAQRRTFQGHLPEVERNYLWILDYKRLDFPVLVSPWHTEPAFVWLTTVLELFSRAVLAWVISVQPTRGEAMTALANAARSRPGEPFGAAPLNLLHDNAPALCAEGMTAAALVLGASVPAQGAFDPNPYIESYHRTLDLEWQIGKPFSTLGPKRPDGTPYGPAAPPMPIKAAVASFAEYVQHFNYTRVHGGTGEVPAMRYARSSTPLRLLPEADLRSLLTERRKVRTVIPEGFKVNNRIYIHPRQTDLVGERVEIGEYPNDDTQIDIYVDGHFLCTAIHRDQAPPEMIAAAYKHRQETLSAAGAYMRTKSARQGVALRSMHAPQEPQIATAATVEEAVADMRRAGRVALPSVVEVLGLTNRLNRSATADDASANGERTNAGHDAHS
jgi:transposase InsO family protein